MNERKTKGLTNLNFDEKVIRQTYVSLARMYFSQFAAISCYNRSESLDIHNGVWYSKLMHAHIIGDVCTPTFCIPEKLYHIKRISSLKYIPQLRFFISFVIELMMNYLNYKPFKMTYRPINSVYAWKLRHRLINKKYAVCYHVFI